MELINKKEFVATALNQTAETFVVHVVTLSTPTSPKMQIHPPSQAQVGLLLVNKALVKIPPKYLDYADVFLFDLAIELPENTGMNEHAIKLIENKYPTYGPIYNLGPLELETLKTYIETHYLKTRFIRPSKSSRYTYLFWLKAK